MNKYLTDLNQKDQPEIIQEILSQAEKFETPIISWEGINLIVQLLKLTNAKKVLEIGTAIGFSAIYMSLSTGVEVTTIERNEFNYKIAKENILKANLNNQINLIMNDALEYQTDEVFDLIFIDAAKAQYYRFFEKYKTNLKPKGIIICDNLLFHGLVEKPEESSSRNVSQLVRKIDDFNKKLVSHPEFDTYIYEIGDGFSISIKK
ncbi:MAG: O-methyltransferase [Candidatus Izemoplasmatales bacterium]